MRSLALPPTVDVVTPICSCAVLPELSATVAMHAPAATPVTVTTRVGPFPLVGLIVATGAQVVDVIVRVPVYPVS